MAKSEGKVKDKVLITGHSYVYWLRQYGRSRPAIPALPSALPLVLALGLEQYDVKFQGMRGAKLTHYTRNAIFDEIKRSSPKMVVLQLGGNDLDSQIPPQLIGMRLYEFAKDVVVRHSCVKQIVVCQAIRRRKWRHLSYEEGAARVATFNEFIVAACGGCAQIKVWKHKGMWLTQHNIFRRDGVHMNELGNHKFYRSMRGAVLKYGKLL